MSNCNQINSIAGRIAGYSVNDPSTSTQSATNVKLKVPTNVATDYLGNVYVADSLNNVIEKITPYGTINVVANGLNNPQGVTVDSSLNIYIADTGNNLIKIVTPTGSITGTIIAGGGQNFPSTTSQLATNVLLNNPVGIALDSLRNIYVADVNNNVIEKITPNGNNTWNMVVIAGGNANAPNSKSRTATKVKLNNPINMAKDSNGNIYIADTNNNLIEKVDVNGNLTIFAGGGTNYPTTTAQPATSVYLVNPTGIAVDSSNNIYVSDTNNNVIEKITPAGQLSVIAGSVIGGVAVFSPSTTPQYAITVKLGYPTSVAVDNLGNIYLNDNNLGLIEKITLDYKLQIIAGGGSTVPSTSPIDATLALIGTPTGITVDSLGDVYVADSSYNLIEKITTVGSINVIAGGGEFVPRTSPQLATSVKLNEPIDVAVDSAGNIYIADSSNNLIEKITTDGNLIVIAGGGEFVPTTASQLATNVKLNEPTGVIVDSVGNIYIADSSNNFIEKITSGNLSVIAGSKLILPKKIPQQATSLLLGNPKGVALDSTGNVYITDTNNSFIEKITTDGSLNIIAGDGSSAPTYSSQLATNVQLGNPSGITVDSIGNIYVADTNNNFIEKITNGNLTVIAGDGTNYATINKEPSNTIQLNNPQGVAVDYLGNVFISDTNNNLIEKLLNGNLNVISGADVFDPRTIPQSSDNVNLINPSGVARDSTGNIYIADKNNNVIEKVTPEGQLSVIAGGGVIYPTTTATNATQVKLNSPTGVVVDSLDNIYIADTGNNLIEKVTSDGNIAVIAGVGSQVKRPLYKPQPATSVYLNSPNDVAVDSSGNIYIVDTENDYIEKVTPDGNISIIVGGGGNNPTDFSQTATTIKLSKPVGISVDSSNNIYISDNEGDYIEQVTPDGKLKIIGGIYAVEPNMFYPEPLQQTRLNHPAGVCLDSSGNIYIANSFGGTSSTGNIITKVFTNETIISISGGGTNSPSTIPQIGNNVRFNRSQGVSLDTSGNIYVADSNNNYIEKITSDGVLIVIAGGGTNNNPTTTPKVATSVSLSNPQCVILDKTGNIYIADTDNDLIEKITPDGKIVVVAGGGSITPDTIPRLATSVSLNKPSGIALDNSGNIYIADTENNLIEQVDTNGNLFVIAGGKSNLNITTYSAQTATSVKLTFPTGVTVDNSGNVYISENYNYPNIDASNPAYSYIDIIDTSVNRQIYHIAGSPQFINGQSYSPQPADTLEVYYPFGMTVDSSNNIYVTDQRTASLYKITKTNETYFLRTVAGFINYSSESFISNKPEPSLNMYIRNPRGLVADSSNNVYFSDEATGFFLKIVVKDKTFTVVAGVGNETGFVGYIPTTTPTLARTIQFQSLYYLAVDKYDNLYFASVELQCVGKLTKDGYITLIAGGGTNIPSATQPYPATSVKLNYCASVDLDLDGNIYIVENYNRVYNDANSIGDSRVLKINGLTNELIVIAGGGLSNPSVIPQLATDVRINNALGIAVDLSNNFVYIADVYDNIIEKLTKNLDGTYNISIIAGIISHTPTIVPQIPTTINLSNPTNVIVDSSNNVYIADSGNNVIEKIDSDTGKLSVVAGGGVNNLSTISQLATSAKLNNPQDLDIDNTGNIYIADTNNNVIEKVDKNGQLTVYAGYLVNQVSKTLPQPANTVSIDYPISVVTDSSGNVYSSSYYNLIQKITPDGNTITIAGGGSFVPSTIPRLATDVQLGVPYGLFVDLSHNLYVADTFNNFIEKITPDGMLSVIAGSCPVDIYSNTISTPQLQNTVNLSRRPATLTNRSNIRGKVGFDSLGNIYIPDYYNSSVEKLTPDGKIILIAGGDGNTLNPSYSPELGTKINLDTIQNLVVDSKDNVYIINVLSGVTEGTGTVLKYTQDGNLSVIAGGRQNNNVPTYLPQPATKVRLNGPNGIGIDLSDNIYITEGPSQINRILKITPHGYLSIIAGGGANPITTTPQSANTVALPFPIVDVACDSSNNIYVCGQGSNCIYRITPSGGDIGNISIYYGAGTIYKPTLTTPTSVACGSNGVIYVTVDSTGTVIKVNSDRSSTVIAGGGANQPLDIPQQATSIKLNVGTYGDSDYFTAASAGVDSLGNVYISDFVRALILKVTPDGLLTSIAGFISYTPSNIPRLATTISLNTPIGVALDLSQNIYVSDTNNGFIEKITSDGKLVIFKNVSVYATLPFGLALDLSNNIYATLVRYNSNYTSYIVRFNPSGVINLIAGGGSNVPTTSWQSAYDVKINTPTGVSVDSSNNVYISDFDDNYIEQIRPNGTIAVIAGGGNNAPSNSLQSPTNVKLINPFGVTLDLSRNIYIADSGNNFIEKIGVTDGSLNIFAGFLPTGSSPVNYTSTVATTVQLNGPQGLTTDSLGNVYISDTNNNYIEKITTDGNIVVIAGGGDIPISTDSQVAKKAKLGNPIGLTTDSLDNIYIADNNNNVVEILQQFTTPPPGPVYPPGSTSKPTVTTFG